MIPASVLGLIGAGGRLGEGPPVEPEALWTPAPARRVCLPRAGLSVWCLDTGGPGDPVVLVHGLSSTMGYWRYQVQALVESGRRVLALDLPGFGASDKPDAPYTPRWYSEVVLEWLEVQGLGPIPLAGHSMGGQVALHLVLQAPERISRLVLAAPAGVETFSPAAATWMRDYWHATRALEATPEEVRANFTALAFNRVDDDVLRLLDERVRLQRHPCYRDVSRAVSRCVRGMLDQPVAARLREISVPTLFIWGNRDRMIPNPVFNPGPTRAIAERGAAAIPGSRLVVLPGAGHMVMHDDPRGFNSALIGFLDP